MSKDDSIPVIDRIRQRQQLRESRQESPQRNTAPVREAEVETGKKAEQETEEGHTAASVDNILATGGFEQLYKVLASAKDDLDIDRRIVYIDDDSAEVLDLLRRKAKIKASALVSFMLQELFKKHKHLIQELIEKRSNKLLD